MVNWSGPMSFNISSTLEEAEGIVVNYGVHLNDILHLTAIAGFELGFGQ